MAELEKAGLPLSDSRDEFPNFRRVQLPGVLTKILLRDNPGGALALMGDFIDDAIGLYQTMTGPTWE